MNIYSVYQNEIEGYDTFSNFVVVAESEEEAKSTHPYGGELREYDFTWPSSTECIKADLIGVASDDYKEVTIICSSFHAG